MYESDNASMRFVYISQPSYFPTIEVFVVTIDGSELCNDALSQEINTTIAFTMKNCNEQN